MSSDPVSSLQNFLAAVSMQHPIVSFMIHCLLAAILALALGGVYTRYGSAISNRRLFARSFLLISLTTLLYVSIVRSSVALALGVIGALAIVRFRAAIKEPEELVYLVLAVGIGLGMGAEQAVLTIFAFAVMLSVVVIRGELRRPDRPANLHVILFGHDPSQVKLATLIETVTRNAAAAELKRSDDTGGRLEATFRVDMAGSEQLSQMKSALKELSDGVKVSYLNDRKMTPGTAVR
ncbi:MAG TPA: DUF4956 domain-containing protein [Vicinamibacteria bacterium]|nr:DUF4956 domain-containing protein [Vicinamibacteria bacterium]